MPTKRERQYYRMGYRDGVKQARIDIGQDFGIAGPRGPTSAGYRSYAKDKLKPRTKRKLSAWNKFVKANSKKKIYRYANGKLKLKKMGIAFRKKKRR